MRRRGLLLVVLLAVGITAWLLLAGGPSQKGPAAPPAVPVTVSVAALQDVPQTLDGIGTVQAYYSVTVHSRVDGQLDSVAFREGQDVHTGDTLAQIDPRTFQAALQQAEAKKAQDAANLANAELDLKRYAYLVANQSVARQQYDTTKAQVAQLQATILADEAAIQSARVQLGYTTITSPIDGRVGIRQIDPGNIIHATDTTGLVVITQIHPIALIFSLPEGTLPDIVEAMANERLAVTAYSPDGSRKLDEGSLELVDNQIDQTTGTVRLKAIMPNPQGLLWPGQYVTARLLLRLRRGVVTVPAIAVQRGEQGRFAYVVQADGTVQARPVKPEFQEGLAIINEGLKAGETVVTTGQYRLQPGSKVEVAPSAPAPVQP